jgi:hypothetical protein
VVVTHLFRVDEQTPIVDARRDHRAEFHSRLQNRSLRA